ncbi:hypothetical protein L1887_49648 [Cichorium endivia]|nr:hypothetical protein L1887_49648 [Cichorium endivia]
MVSSSETRRRNSGKNACRERDACGACCETRRDRRSARAASHVVEIPQGSTPPRDSPQTLAFPSRHPAHSCSSSSHSHTFTLDIAPHPRRLDTPERRAAPQQTSLQIPPRCRKRVSSPWLHPRPSLPTISINVDYDEERQKITDFLCFFKAPASRLTTLVSHGAGAPISLEDADDDQDELERELSGAIDRMDVDRSAAQRRSRARAEAEASSSRQVPFYMHQLQNIANREQDSLVVELDDGRRARQHNNGRVGRTARRSHPQQCKALCGSVRRVRGPPGTRAKQGHLAQGRRARRHPPPAHGAQRPHVESAQDPNDTGVAPEDASDNVFPPVLLRRYTLYLKPSTRRVAGEQPEEPLAVVRAVRGSHLGKAHHGAWYRDARGRR